MSAGKPDLHAVSSDDPASSTRLRAFSKWEKRATITLVTLLMLLSAASLAVGIVSFQLTSSLKDVIRHQEAVITSATDELAALRMSIDGRSVEEIVFLKTIVLKRNIDRKLARQIAVSILDHSKTMKADPDFVLAMIAVESAFEPSAKSNMGALGLMQIMPHWTTTLGIKEPLTDVDTSIRYGIQIYNVYHDMFKDQELALAAYNRGPAGVDYLVRKGGDPREGYAASIMKVYRRLKTMQFTEEL